MRSISKYIMHTILTFVASEETLPLHKKFDKITAVVWNTLQTLNSSYHLCDGVSSMSPGNNTLLAYLETLFFVIWHFPPCVVKYTPFSRNTVRSDYVRYLDIKGDKRRLVSGLLPRWVLIKWLNSFWVNSASWKIIPYVYDTIEKKKKVWFVWNCLSTISKPVFLEILNWLSVGKTLGLIFVKLKHFVKQFQILS